MIKLVAQLIACYHLEHKQTFLDETVTLNPSPIISQVDLRDPRTENSFVRISQMDIT